MVNQPRGAANEKNGRNAGISYFISFRNHRPLGHFIHNLKMAPCRSGKPRNLPFSYFMPFANRGTKGSHRRMPQNVFIDLLKPGTLVVAGILFGLAACTENAAGVYDDFAPVFWEQKDDFTEMDAYYLDAKVWIDREGGEYLDLQFQCFRHSGAQLSIDQNLIVSSSIEANRPYGSAAYLDAVLYKSEGESPRIYRNGYDGTVLSTFTNATLDIGDMLSLDENDNYRSLQLRFIYGASPLTAQTGDVAALSRAASVDFELSANNPETGKFLRACAPVKNWVPPE